MTAVEGGAAQVADWPTVRIGYLYPEWMNLYGDRGNAMALERRAAWRGIPVATRTISVGDTVDLAAHDILLVGGGSDDAQNAISADLLEKRAPALFQAVEEDVVVLAVCGGYQLLGHYYKTAAGEKIPGIGLLNVWTEAGPTRLVGDVVAEGAWDGAGQAKLVGYENHSGRTYLGSGVRPLARVICGRGNNGRDGGEGAVYRNLFGTYLHGPLLPKNPAFADHLLGLALARNGVRQPLPLLDDALETLAHDRAAARALARNRRRGRG